MVNNVPFYEVYVSENLVLMVPLIEGQIIVEAVNCRMISTAIQNITVYPIPSWEDSIAMDLFINLEQKTQTIVHFDVIVLYLIFILSPFDF